ncbi:MAG TPA: DUF6338 family protein, partial [Oculatellaceae cyanobacterium]
MAFLGLDKLDNLQELRQMQHMDQLQNLDKLQEMRNMNQLQNLDKLQELREMQHLDQLQNMDKLQDLQHMDQLQNLDKLTDLQHMDHLQNLDKLALLEQMKDLQQIKHLNQLGLLDRMNALNQLGQLRDIQYMTNLNSLKSLDNLQVLNRLQIFDRLFQVETLLYLSSLLVPGFIFQEVVSLLLGSVSLKRALALMIVYNLLSLFLCLLFGYSYLQQLSDRPVAYYSGWFALLVIIPAIIGWLIALITPSLNRLFTRTVNIPTRLMANHWGKVFAGQAAYQIIITMNNEEKIRGIVSKSIPSPSAADPGGGLYLMETSH